MQGLPATLEPPPLRLEPAELRTGRCAAIHYARRASCASSADGHWVGELQGDTILESEYILLHGVSRPGATTACRRLRELHPRPSSSPDGGWSNYPGGPPDVSVSVKAYFALKLAGHVRRSRTCAAPASDPLARRRRCVQQLHEVLPRALGQFPYAQLPGRAAGIGAVCRAGSTSTSTPCRAGRGRSSCR